jgi:CheY-like chemotaxis protein
MAEKGPFPNGNEGDKAPSIDHAQQEKSSTKIGLRDLVPLLANILKATGWLVLLLFVLLHWSYFGQWFSSATHVEFPGVKIDRFVQASERIEENASTFKARDPEFQLEFAKAAIVRAERAAPAIKGALVLWVDDNPPNNQLELQILGDLGIRFVTALSTQEAMERLDRYKDKYDLIISNVGRKEPPTRLSSCPVHYFEWQSDDQRKDFNGNLDAFNAEVNAKPPGGFSLMEQIEEKYGDRKPPIIFFTASSGGKVATLCSKTITNRVDELLQSVVTNLEEQRWQELQNDTQSTSPSR